MAVTEYTDGVPTLGQDPNTFSTNNQDYVNYVTGSLVPEINSTASAMTTSEINAAASEANAAASEINAAASEANAAASEVSATASKANAAASEINAAASEANAAASEVSATASEANAAASEINAAASEANAAASEINAAASEANAAASEVSATASKANAAASEINAATSAYAAQSVANYQGVWSTLTGPYSLGISVSHNSKTWRLDVNLADITLSEPGVSGDWTEIGAKQTTIEWSQSTIYVTQTMTGVITNYDSLTDYIVSSLIGSVSISGDTITYTAPSETGSEVVLVNGVGFNFEVVDAGILAPSITSIADNETDVKQFILTGTAFESAPAGFYTHNATDYQFATDVGFTSIVVESLSSTDLETKSFSPNLFTESTVYYARMRYKDTIAAVNSEWSSTITFTSSASFYPQDEQAKIQASDIEAGDQFGQSVAISGDTVIIGAAYEDTGGANAGAAYIFIRTGTTWTEQAKIQASDAEADDQFGYSVAIDGDTVIVGANAEDTGGSNVGAAYIFTRTGTVWTEQAKIQASDAEASDQFGWSVAISGDTVIVGAAYEDTGGANAGAAYIFTRTGTVWTEQAKIQASDAEAGDTFGYTVAISGDTVIVGANAEDTGGANAGAAYIFTRTGTTWTEQAKIQASDAEASDLFGYSVAISGDTVIVGARDEDTGGTNTGAAYIFIRTGTVWTEQVKIQASDIEAGDNFGYSVAISGDTVIVGALSEDTGGVNAGAAYIFTRTGTVWTEQAKIQASDIEAGDQFGYSVAIDGDTVIVGARSEDTGGANAGAAYIFV